MPDYNYFPAKRPEPKPPKAADLGLDEPPRLLEIGGVPVEKLESNGGPAAGVFDDVEFTGKWSTIERPVEQPKRRGRKGKR